MDRVYTRRWMILLSALVLTIAAILYPVEEVVTPSAPTAPTATISNFQKKLSFPLGNSTSAISQSATVEQSKWVATNEDPFSPRNWPSSVVLPTAETVERHVEQIELPNPTPPPPSPLPFGFLGQMTDGGLRVIYLKMGEQVLLARAGDVVDGGYKVLTVDANQIVFESVASGVRQTLSIPAQAN